MPSEMSRMLPGMPLWPYGIFSGSTSMVLPLGRNVTLYFFVAGLYLTSSMYGLLPPMIYPQKIKNGGVKPPLQFAIINLPAVDHAAGCRILDRLKPVLPKPSDFGRLAAFERCRNGGIHQQLREMLGCTIQFVDALAN